MKYLNKILPVLFLLLPALLLGYGLTAHAEKSGCVLGISGHDTYNNQTYWVECDGKRYSRYDVEENEAYKLRDRLESLTPEEREPDRYGAYEDSAEYKAKQALEEEQRAKDEAMALVHPPISY